MREYVNKTSVLNRYTVLIILTGVLLFLLLYNTAYGYFDYMESIYIVSIVYWAIFLYGFKIVNNKLI